MKLGESLLQLYNLFLGLIEAIGGVWEWLFEPIKIFPGLSFKLFQWTITLIPVVEFPPILLISAGGILTLITWWAIKSLVPMA